MGPPRTRHPKRTQGRRTGAQAVGLDPAPVQPSAESRGKWGPGWVPSRVAAPPGPEGPDAESDPAQGRLPGPLTPPPAGKEGRALAGPDRDGFPLRVAGPRSLRGPRSAAAGSRPRNLGPFRWPPETPQDSRPRAGAGSGTGSGGVWRVPPDGQGRRTLGQGRRGCRSGMTGLQDRDAGTGISERDDGVSDRDDTASGHVLSSGRG